jgi:hypothetical protein
MFLYITYFLYGNFTDFRFKEEESTPVAMSTMIAPPLTVFVKTEPSSPELCIKTEQPNPEPCIKTEPSSLEPCIKTETFSIETKPPIDRFEEVKKFITNFDYGVEVFDWECFEQDIDDIEEIDFTRYV